MKKIFMIAAMAVAAVTANAQVWIGGNLGFNTETSKVEIAGFSTDNTTSNFEIAPEIGYNLSDQWAVAIALGYAHTEGTSMTFGDETVTGNINAFTIKPYARYTFVKAGNFSAFCDGYVSYSTAHMQNVENNINTFGIGLAPGIAYAVSPKVTLVAHVGKLGYDHTSYKQDTVVGEAKYTNNKFDFNITNSIYFGAYVNL